MAFWSQLCQVRRSVTPNIIFRKISERPWLDAWWPLLLGYKRCLSLLPDDSLRLDILQDKIAVAGGPLPCANRARGTDLQFATLGMVSPFFSSGIGLLAVMAS